MTDYFYNNKGGRRLSGGSRPFCARCGNVVEDAQVSSTRGSWADKGRGLNLEIDGREGRQVRRRHSSAGLNNLNQRGSPLHCYMVPVSNAAQAVSTPTSTYRESFGSPSASQWVSRHARSTPSSPVSAMSPWSSTSSSSFSSPLSPNRQPVSSTDPHSLLSRLPAKLHNRDGSLERRNTTYRDHFTWIS